MQKYQSIISGTNGSVIRNVPVTVLKEDGSLAEIFMDREGQVQAPNPLVTDSRGVFYFYAKNGRYSLRTAADGVQITDADTVLLFDPDETATDGPIADAVRRAEDAAERAETALGDSGLQNMVQDAQDAAANAVQAVIDANQAVASIDAALIEAGEAKEAAQAAAQTASNAASGAQAVKDSLLTYSGTLSATPEWSAVPAHVDLNLDTQAQALANRSELLRDNQKRTPLHFATLAEASSAAATLPDGQAVTAVVNDATLNYSVYGNELVPEPVRKGDGQINVRKFISSQIDGVTSNQVGIVAAVASAFASGSDLMWPAGTYISDANIPYFHNVRHIGPGVIKRGSVLYAVDPSPSTSLNLYVSPAGSDVSDGLSADHPLATLQAACSIIQNARTTNGRWRVNLAQGTYTDGCSLENFRNRDYRVRFVGPAVALNATPLAIVDGAGALAKSYGFNFANCGDVEIRDVKLINFNKNLESSSGVLAANTRLLRLYNVHADNCGVGWSMRSFTFYFVTGGRITNCRYGVLELFHVVRNFETVSDLASGASISQCVYGIFSKEHCTGHLDWTTIEDNTYGIYFSRSSTANASDCRVRRNSVGVNLRNGSFLVPNRVDWGTGTANRNGKPFIKDGTSNFVTNEGTTQAGGALAQGEATMATYSPETPLSHTGTTTATTLLQLGSIQPGALVQPGVYARGVVLGRKSGAAGAVTLEMRIGSVAGASITIPASTTVFKAEFWIISQGQDKQLAFATLVSDTNAPANVGRNVRTVAVESLGASFSLRSTLASAADTLIVDAAFSYTTDVAGPVEPSAA